MSDFTFIAIVIILYKLVAQPLIVNSRKRNPENHQTSSIKKESPPQQKDPETPGDYVDYEEVK